jgi:hypothetical protein
MEMEPMTEQMMELLKAIKERMDSAHDEEMAEMRAW